MGLYSLGKGGQQVFQILNNDNQNNRGDRGVWCHVHMCMKTVLLSFKFHLFMIKLKIEMRILYIFMTFSAEVCSNLLNL